MKIIFLDFDGVIRVPLEGSSDSYFCQTRMKWLKYVCDTTNAKIVISSDWRIFLKKDLNKIKECLYPYLSDYLHLDWCTPVIGNRGIEIDQWLHQHKQVEKYIILDDIKEHFIDCSDNMRKNLLILNYNKGIETQNIPHIINMLNV